MLSKLHKKILILKGLLAVVSLVIAGCGVKGDPKPPETTPYIGTGQPNYRKAAEKIPLQKYSPSEDEEKEEKEPEDE
jgi:Prokaryotic lipoprotein-attachment site